MTCKIYPIRYYQDMNQVRQLRTQLGLTQQDLAKQAGTSQATIALYETGAKSPTLSTLHRIAKTLGLEVIIHYVPSFTREDYRSLAYHQRVVSHLQKDFVSVKKQAKKNLVKMKKLHPDAKALFNVWRLWLTLPREELSARILDPGMWARDMRQVSPFAGILSPKERVQVIREFQKTYPQ